MNRFIARIPRNRPVNRVLTYAISTIIDEWFPLDIAARRNAFDLIAESGVGIDFVPIESTTHSAESILGDGT